MTELLISLPNLAPAPADLRQKFGLPPDEALAAEIWQACRKLILLSELYPRARNVLTRSKVRIPQDDELHSELAENERQCRLLLAYYLAKLQLPALAGRYLREARVLGVNYSSDRNNMDILKYVALALPPKQGADLLDELRSGEVDDLRHLIRAQSSCENKEYESALKDIGYVSDLFAPACAELSARCYSGLNRTADELAALSRCHTLLRGQERSAWAAKAQAISFRLYELLCISEPKRANALRDELAQQGLTIAPVDDSKSWEWISIRSGDTLHQKLNLGRKQHNALVVLFSGFGTQDTTYPCNPDRLDLCADFHRALESSLDKMGSSDTEVSEIPDADEFGNRWLICRLPNSSYAAIRLRHLGNKFQIDVSRAWIVTGLATQPQLATIQREISEPQEGLRNLQPIVAEAATDVSAKSTIRSGKTKARKVRKL